MTPYHERKLELVRTEMNLLAQIYQTQALSDGQRSLCLKHMLTLMDEEKRLLKELETLENLS